MDRAAWWATVPRVAKSQTRLSNFTSLHLAYSYPRIQVSGEKILFFMLRAFPVVMYGYESWTTKKAEH